MRPGSGPRSLGYPTIVAVRLVESPQLSPFGTEQLRLRYNVGVPHGTDDQKKEADISENDSEEPANCRQAAKHLLALASQGVAVLRGPPSVLHLRRPYFNVFQNVSSEIGHDEERGEDDEVGRAVFVKV